MNTKTQGNIGVGQAVAYFTNLQYMVSIPISESQRYDLIVDDGARLMRVETKTTGYRPKKSFIAGLSTQGGNQTWNKTKKFLTKEDCDLVFIYTLDGSAYVFPVEKLNGKASITLATKYDEYKVFG